MPRSLPSPTECCFQPTLSSSTTSGQLFSGFFPVFQGICHGVGVATAAFGLTGQARLQRVNAFQVDLQAAGIDFLVTPLAEQPSGGSNGCTKGNTVSGFMAQNPSVMVAINANFTYCDKMQFSTSNDYGILGYLASPSSIICTPQSPGWSPTSSPLTAPDVQTAADAGAQALILQKNSDGSGYTASFQTMTANDSPGADDYIAVAGSAQPADGGKYAPTACVTDSSGNPMPLMLVSGGENCYQTLASSSPREKVAARTAIGVDPTGRYLLLLTVDGLESADINSGYPQYGAGFADLAEWMLTIGAYNALNLDGGGSAVTAMRTSVVDNQATPPLVLSGPDVLNIPYGNEDGNGRGTPGAQRPLGCFLGIIANSLA
jgi:hypothetical protein